MRLHLVTVRDLIVIRSGVLDKKGMFSLCSPCTTVEVHEATVTAVKAAEEECAHCHQRFRRDEEMLNASGKIWHSSCFV